MRFPIKKIISIYSKGLLYAAPILIPSAIDQISKYFLIEYLQRTEGMTIKITYFLSLVYAWNYGISFGIFSNYYQYSNSIFLLLNSLIVSYILYLYVKTTNLLERIGFGIVAGGAIGNILDRIFRGAVFDFIFFHYGEYSFPAFNLGDACINVGGLLLLLSLMKSSKK